RPASHARMLLAASRAAPAAGHAGPASASRAGPTSGEVVHRNRYGNSSAQKMLAHTIASITLAHHECERGPVHDTGSRSPPPTSTGGWSGPGSASNSQRRIMATASTPKAAAGSVSLAV